MSSNNSAIAIPVQPSYGAVELKEFIRKNTWRSFIITMIVVILLLLINIVLALTSKNDANENLVRPHINMVEVIKPPTEDVEEQQVEIPPDASQIVFGMEQVAGNPVPVPDAEITEELAEFVSYEDITRATSQVGNVDIESVPDFKVEDLQKQTIVAPSEDIPDHTQFIPVEKEPGVDLAELQKKVVYPEMARKANIEGRVLIRVYVDKTGKPKKTEVLMTDSKMLNDAAIDAIMKATYTPAIQNKQPIGCWVSIPVVFKLR